eukprot:Pgem_evm1s8315
MLMINEDLTLNDEIKNGKDNGDEYIISVMMTPKVMTKVNGFLFLSLRRMKIIENNLANGISTYLAFIDVKKPLIECGEKVYGLNYLNTVLKADCG